MSTISTLDQRGGLVSLKGGLQTARRIRTYEKLKAEQQPKLGKKKVATVSKKKRKLTSKKPLIRIQGKKY